MGGREAAILAGYSTVKRPSPRPPIQMSVLTGAEEEDVGVCSKATSFLLYLWRVPGCAILVVGGAYIKAINGMRSAGKWNKADLR